jgi:hypothetical protein
MLLGDFLGRFHRTYCHFLRYFGRSAARHAMRDRGRRRPDQASTAKCASTCYSICKAGSDSYKAQHGWSPVRYLSGWHALPVVLRPPDDQTVVSLPDEDRISQSA